MIPNKKQSKKIDNYNSLISSMIGSGKMLGLQDGEGLSRQVVSQHDPHSMHQPYQNKQISRGPATVGPNGTAGANLNKNINKGFGNDDGINHVI